MTQPHTSPRRPAVLIILDGFGINPSRRNNAVCEAKTPRFDEYFSSYPHAVLEASGAAVGLPDGQSAWQSVEDAIATLLDPIAPLARLHNLDCEATDYDVALEVLRIFQGAHGMGADAVSALLLKLELQGLIANLPGGQYQRVR